MTTRGEINSNFYQIVNVDGNGAPTSVKPEYLPNVGNANYAANAGHANIADVANLVAVANVSGIGNIATINLSGNGSQLLAGNGTWIETPNTANANYANFAGNAFSVSGSNVIGIVGNATHANISDSANSVSVANVSGIGNIAVLNLTGSSSNVLYGNGVWAGVGSGANANYANFAGNAFSVDGANVVGDVAGANHANIADIANVAYSVDGANVTGQVANALVAGTVYTNAQPNITSLGTITSLTSTGNITAPYFLGNVVGNISGNIVVPGLQWNILYNNSGNAGASNNFIFNATTNVATITGNVVANYFVGDGSLLSNITGANVVGDVANANHANIADVANSVSGSNVSGAVNLADYATVANSVAGANVSGYVANATHANIADSANSVAGGNITGQVANALVAGTVYTNSQPNITSVGTLTELTVLGNITGNSQLFIGYGANTTGFTNPTIIAKSAGGQYIQSAIINSSSTGSADLLAYGDNGSDSEAWSDLGFTGSLFNDANYTITMPNDGYFFVQGDAGNVNGGNLVLATGSQGTTKDIVFATGGFLSTNEKMRFIDSTGQFYIKTTTATTSNSTGALRVAGGIGAAGNIYSSGNITANYFVGNGSALTGITSTTGNANYANYAGNAFSVSGSNVSGAVNLANFATVANSVAGANVSGAVAFATTANSVAGANVSGAVAFATTANSVAGANVSGAVAFATTANSVAGANVSGTVANATFATTSGTAGTVTTNAQPNITSVGTLTSLTVTGNITGNYFIGNGSALTGITAASATTAITVTGNAQPNITSTGTLTSLDVSGNVTASRLISNVATGTAPFVVTSTTLVANLNVANAGNASSLLSTVNTVYASPVYPLFTALNITGVSAISKNTGISANLANNSFTATTFVGSLSGTATSATTAGTVTTNAQPNITSVGTLTSLSVTGNITSGNASLGNLVVGNYFSGNGSLLTGVTASSATTAVTVTGNAQPNITSVGTLTSLAVTGNITSGNASLGNLVVGNYHSGDGSLLSNITAGNISGQVANSLVAGTVYTNAQPNITSVGTLTALSVTSSSLTANAPINLNQTWNNTSVAFTGLRFNTTNSNSAATSKLLDLQVNTVSQFSVAATGNVTGNYFIGNGSALTGVTASPAGSNTQIQFNDNGLTNAISAFTFNKTSNTMSIGNTGSIFIGLGSGTDFVTLNSGGSGNISAGGTIVAVSANISNVALTKFTETLPASANTSTSIAPDLGSGTIYKYLANNSFTFNGFTSPVVGQSGTVIITQDSIGGRTMSSTMKFSGGSKTLSTAANAIDIISVFYDGTTYYAVLSKGYA